eukprot:2369392-Amphidinium_carterae.1
MSASRCCGGRTLAMDGWRYLRLCSVIEAGWPRGKYPSHMYTFVAPLWYDDDDDDDDDGRR